MKAKKGISLIVLVITIIVIIILAGAVILSLSKNNPIEQANQAKMESDKSEVQSAVTLFIAKAMAVTQGPVEIATTDGKLIGAKVTYVGGTDITGDRLTALGGSATIGNDTLGVTIPANYTGYTWKIDAVGNVTLAKNVSNP